MVIAFFPPTTHQVSWLEKKLTAAQNTALRIKNEYDIYPLVHFITLFSYKSVITNRNLSQEQ